MPFSFTVILMLMLCAGASYLLGSLNSAVIFTKIFKKEDVRKVGSGNAGMTNAFRVGGKAVGTLTLLGDLLKVAAAVCIGRYLIFPYIAGIAPAQSAAAFDPMLGAYFCGFFCFIGHIYPVFFGFKGGKGVVTAVGTVLMVDWRLLIVTLGTFFIVLAISKYVSLSSIIAAVVFPAGTFLLYPFSHESGFTYGFFNLRLAETLVSFLIAVMIIIKHIPNIKRLLAGTENSIKKKIKG